MYNFIMRNKSKKGFTMVELIIVIAIIGILLAMILPAFFNSDLTTKGKAYARSYFYVVQDFMSRQRITADLRDNPPLDPVVLDYYFYTTVDNSGNVVESGVVNHSSGSFTGMSNSAAVLADVGITNDDYKALVEKYAFYMESSVTPTEHAGTFYCVVDSNYCVQATYWSEATIDELTSGGNSTLLFDDSDIVSGYITCAYPVDFSDVAGVSDRKMFDYTY